MGRWLKDGWPGAPPDFIARTDACHTITAPELLFFVCLSPPNVGQVEQLSMAAA